MEAERPIWIVVVDDHPMLRQGTRALLDGTPGMRVVATTGEGAEALRLAERCRPDVLLLDLRLPDISGVAVARRVRAAHPAIAILVLTGYDDAAYTRALLALGVRGYLPKTATGEEIVAAVRALAAGRSALDAAVRQAALAPDIVALTERELEVLRLLVDGRRNQEIADALCIVVKTVEYHVGNILQKLHARSRSEAIRKAQEYGLASPLAERR